MYAPGHAVCHALYQLHMYKVTSLAMYEGAPALLLQCHPHKVKGDV